MNGAVPRVWARLSRWYGGPPHAGGNALCGLSEKEPRGGWGDRGPGPDRSGAGRRHTRGHRRQVPEAWGRRRGWPRRERLAHPLTPGPRHSHTGPPGSRWLSGRCSGRRRHDTHNRQDNRSHHGGNGTGSAASRAGCCRRRGAGPAGRARGDHRRRQTPRPPGRPPAAFSRGSRLPPSCASLPVSARRHTLVTAPGFTSRRAPTARPRPMQRPCQRAIRCGSVRGAGGQVRINQHDSSDAGPRRVVRRRARLPQAAGVGRTD